MRKFLFIFSLLLAICGNVGAYDFEVDGIYYNITDATGHRCSVAFGGSTAKGSTSMYTGAVVIPSSVDYNGLSYVVNAIGDSCFYGCTSLTSIDIPKSIITLGANSFNGCSGVTSIDVSSVKTLYGQCFMNCTALASVTLPESGMNWAHGIFSGCTALKSIVIPKGVTDIRYCFKNCKSLKSIEIPESITSIGIECFYGCDSLESVTIPEGVTSLGNECFRGCKSLKSIELPEGLTSIGSYAFHGCKTLDSIVIPNGVTRVPDGCFGYCSSLTSVVIPEGVTYIGGQCFDYCSKLPEIVMPQSAKSWGGGAIFRGCTSLKSVNIPEGVTSLGNECFRGCKSLKSIDIPESVTSLGVACFYGCTSLKSIDIPESVTLLGANCFRSCYSLTSIVIPESVTALPLNCFYDCRYTKSITIPKSVATIGANCFYYCCKLDSVVIPEGVTALPEGCFSGCFKLKNIYVPKSVTSLGVACFFNCDGLTSIDLVIPEGVTELPAKCFGYCSGLKNVIIPERITSIGNTCFVGCDSLKVVEIFNPDLASLMYKQSYENAFYDTKVSDYYVFFDNDELKNNFAKSPYVLTFFFTDNIPNVSYATRKLYTSPSSKPYDGVTTMFHFCPNLSKQIVDSLTKPRNYSIPDKFFGKNRLWPKGNEINNGRGYNPYATPQREMFKLPLLRADAPLLDAVVPITDNTWHTLCLPINWTPDKDVYGNYQLLTLTRVLRNVDEHSIKFIFSPSTDTCVVAWKPYLFKAGDDFVYDPEKATRILDYPLQPGSEQYVAITAEQVGEKKESTEWTYYWVGNNEGLYHKSGEETDGFSIDRPRYAYYLGERGGDTSLFFQRTTSQRVWAPYTAAIMAYCEDYQTDETPGITVNDDFRDEDGTANAQKTIITCFGDEGGETTVIEELSSPIEQRVNGDIFDISGRKVASGSQDLTKLPAGVYICNGKKVLVK